MSRHPDLLPTIYAPVGAERQLRFDADVTGV